MEFQVTEIKMLGQGLSRSLSLRLDAVQDPNAVQSYTPEKSRYTIHVVVPFSPEFGNVQVGQTFSFNRSITELAKDEMGKALPVILELLKNPKFVKEVNERGYQFDAVSIFQALVDATAWKSKTPLFKKI